ncbi:MAG: OmcA/MtrC family decaheme c-type cytochrome [Thiobacillaceae bacterium]
MTITKHLTIMRLGLVALAAAAIVGCGSSSSGGGGGGGGGNPPPANLSAAIQAAAAVPANDGSQTISNPSVGFSVIQGAGTPAITLHSPLSVNFTVFDHGAPVQGLRLGNESDATTPGANLTACGTSTTVNGQTVKYARNLRFMVAKLNPGTNSNPDEWQSLIYTGTNGSHHPTTDPTPTPSNSSPTSTLTYHPEGYYTYTFSTDVTDPNYNTTAKNNDGSANTGTTPNTTPWASGGVMTNGVTMAKDGTTAYRLAIQLCYANSQGQQVLVNPYFDFTMGSNGNSTQLTNTDPTKGPYTRVMTDARSCNSCHSDLQPHAGRKDPQYCVMCHNSSMEVSGFPYGLSLKVLAHTIHAGRKLTQAWPSPVNGFQEVGFPQDLRNCTKCHTSDTKIAGRTDPTTGGPDGTVAAVATPQGDNWMNVPTKEACLTCHDDTLQTSPQHVMLSTGQLNNWYTLHSSLGITTASSDASCAQCHGPNGIAPVAGFHWNQQIANRANYQYNILSATVKAPTTSATGTVTVKYSITNPNTGTPYNLTADCSGACTNTNLFGNVSLLFGYYNMNTAKTVADYTSYNNSGSVSAGVTTGTANGDGTYGVTMTIPKNTSTQKAQGTTARLLMYGQVLEPAVSVSDHKTALPALTTLPPGVTTAPAVKTLFAPVAPVVASLDTSVSGTPVPRRNVVTDYSCDNCHGVLGGVSGSNVLGGGTVVVPTIHGTGSTYYAYSTAFHTSGMTSTLSCPICHDVGRLSSGEAQSAAWYASNSLTPVAYNESFTFRRYIHGIHSAGANAVNAPPGVPLGNWTGRAMPFLHGNVYSATGNEDYSVEVSYPAPLDDCTECHVKNAATGNWTFTADQGPLGAVINKCNTFNVNGSVNSGGTVITPLWKAGDALPGGGTAPVAANNYTCSDNGVLANNNVKVDPLTWNVISPQATVCSACHDGLGAANHMINVGGATFGTQTNSTTYPGSEYGQVLAGGPQALQWDSKNATQGNVIGSSGTLQGSIFEACDGCHGNTSGGVNGISGIRVLDVHTDIYNIRITQPQPGD